MTAYCSDLCSHTFIQRRHQCLLIDLEELTAWLELPGGYVLVLTAAVHHSAPHLQFSGQIHPSLLHLPHPLPHCSQLVLVELGAVLARE